MKKLFIAIGLLGFAGIAFALPYYSSHQTILPFGNEQWDLGTSTQRWRDAWIKTLNVSSINASSTNATSTFAGGVKARGFDGGWLTIPQLHLGNGTATTTLTGGNNTLSIDRPLIVTDGSGNNATSTFDRLAATIFEAQTTAYSYTTFFAPTLNATSTTATSTFSNGASATTGGFASAAGITVTGGSILNTSVATSTFSGGLALTSLSASQGILVSGGSLTNTSAATSTWSGGLSLTSLGASNGLTLTGGSIRSSAADLDIFAGGGNDILLNSSGGNVGIGTTSPLTKVDIRGANQTVGAGYDNYGNLFVGTTDSFATDKGGSLALGGLYNTNGVQASYGKIHGKKEGTDGGAGFLNGYLAFETSNNQTSPFSAERMRITSQGNVGIGTTTPTEELSIFSTGSEARVKISNSINTAVSSSTLEFWNNTTAQRSMVGYGNATGSNGLWLWNYDTSSVILGTSDLERMRIDLNGNVGIGETVPQTKLHISGDDNAAATLVTGTQLAVTNNGTAGNNSYINLQSGTTGKAGFTFGDSGDDDVSTIYHNNTGDVLTFTNSGTSMVLTSLGNVGIGTTSPLSKLAVSGGASVGADYNIAAPTNGMIIQGNVGIGTTGPGTTVDILGANKVLGTDEHGVMRIRSSDAFAINKGGSISFGGKYNTAGDYATFASIWGLKDTTVDGAFTGYLAFATSPGGTPTEKMRITTAGNVGIGTTSPLSKLAVSGGASVGADYNIAAPTNGMIIQGNVGIGTTSPTSILAVEQNADTQLGGLTLGANGDNDYRAMFMNTSGVLSFTGGDAPTFNTATLTAGGVWTDAPSFSWLKSDREVLGRDELLDILQGTDIEKFKIIAEGAGGDTHIGIVLDEADPRLASHNAEGEIVGYSPMRVASVAFAGVKELWNKVFGDHETRIEKLEKENKELKARIEKLEAIRSN